MFNYHKERIAFLLVIICIGFIFSSCSTIQRETSNQNNNVPIVRIGEMSEITLVFAKRQNYFNQFGNNDVHPDGIVFYFTIRSLENYNTRTPAFAELRDFLINGNSYQEMTRENNIDAIEPINIAYNVETFRNDEFYKN